MSTTVGPRAAQSAKPLRLCDAVATARPTCGGRAGVAAHDYLDRKFIFAHYNLGLLLERKGDNDGASVRFAIPSGCWKPWTPDGAGRRRWPDAAALAALTHKHLELPADL